MRWAFILFVVAEFLLFDRMTSRHYASVYPLWNDQVQPLRESYTGYEYLKAHGFWEGMRADLTKPAAQGDVHSAVAILMFVLVGSPSRSAALAVNMLALIAWQAVLAFAIVRSTGSRPLGWAAVGLTLALKWPWTGLQGSAVDFRLDQVAMCLMGVCLALGTLTNGFRATGWSCLFGLLIGLTLVTRYITTSYFCLIFAGCLVWSCLSPDRWRRVGKLLLAAAVALAIAFPVFWINRTEIYNHYWIGHYYSPEGDVWDLHRTFAASFLDLCRRLALEQLGPGFAVCAVAFAALAAVGRAAVKRRAKDAQPVTGPGLTGWPGQAVLLGALFLLGPALVLPMQNQDFVGVLSIADPAIIMIAVGLLAAGLGWLERRTPSETARRLAIAGAALSLAAGGGYFVLRQVSAPFSAEFVNDARTANVITDRVFELSREAGLKAPRVSVDQIMGSLDAQIMQVVCYERHRVWVPFVMELPTGVTATTEDVVMERLAASDFVVATEDGPPGVWPFDHTLAAMRPKLLAWCDSHLRLVDRYSIAGRRLALYERRGLRVSGAGGL